MARTTDNEHSGHRERMRKKFIENGFDVFETHEALEMFLYYAIPRKDTNPLAHRLLDRYITVGGVCDAPIDELMKEFGLSENAAALLKMLPEMARLYTESKMSMIISSTMKISVKYLKQNLSVEQTNVSRSCSVMQRAR